MAYNQTQHDIVSPGAKNLAHVNVQSSTDPKRLVSTLSALGVIEDRMATALTTIAASGGSLSEFGVSVYKLDAALRQTEASVETRLAFKASLHKCGLLAEPVR